jgi:beta-mannosidase
MRACLTFYFIFMLIASFAQKHNHFEIPIQWKCGETGQSLDIPANVPGCIHTDLMSANKISDPFLGTNEKDCQWVGEKNWTYQSDPFSVDDLIRDREVQRMRFNGLDTYATVYINDQKVLEVDNAHRSWEVDVKKLLKPTNNIIRIDFYSPIPVGNERLKTLYYPLPGEAIRAISRKPQYHYGWDWGPKLITCGITKPIEVIAYDDIQIQDTYFRTLNENETQTSLQIELTIHSTADRKAHVQIDVDKTNEKFETDIELKKGNNIIKLPITMKYPYRWWCNGQGQANLYTFDIELTNGDQLLDRTIIRHGFRKVHLKTVRDSIGESFHFELNGQAVFIKGANYIPIKYFPGQTNKTDYETLISSCKKANINMLRVWGGGNYEDDYFYELCDQNGIMVWQDFMFACSMYPADSLFVTNVIAEANEQTIRLRKHACMAVWCGNNENAEGWERWGWQQGLNDKQKAKLWRAYKDIFELTLGKAVKDNTDLDYWESSPRFGRGDSRSLSEGDAHYWGVWHDEEPFEVMNAKVPRFMSEFGMQSFPSEQALRDMMTSPNGGYSDAGLLQHQKHNRGFKLMDKYMANWYTPIGHDDLFKYGRLSQAVQAEGIGLGIEAHRRHAPYCMGTMYWQLNDVWPSFSWSGIDYLGKPKLLHEMLTVLYAPQLISCLVSQKKLQIHWISDNFIPNEIGQLTFVIKKFNGEIVHTSAPSEVALQHGSSILLDLPMAALGVLNNGIDQWIEVEIKTAKETYRRTQKLSYQNTLNYIPTVEVTVKDNPMTKKNEERKEIKYIPLGE